MVLAWLTVEYLYPVSLYGAAAWSPAPLREILAVALTFVFVNPALVPFHDGTMNSLPVLLPVMLLVSIVNPALAYLLVRRVPTKE